MKYYFLGIGGIGMSALARYFRAKGAAVAGYDRTRGLVCRELEEEGISIHYIDDPTLIEEAFCDPTDTIVVYTPAIPSDNAEWSYFRERGFRIYKRAQVLGEITRTERGLCIAGTHGKTTTSTILAHLLYQSPIGCNAFLGGLSNNYRTNLLLSDKSSLVVVEADEYDRSFHWLHPYMAVITSADPDHLDIYGTAEAYRDSFEHFSSLARHALVIKKGIAITPRLQAGVELYTYSACEKADFYADHIRVEEGALLFDFHTPQGVMASMQLGVPIWVNIENSVAAMAVAWLNGVDEVHLRSGLASFSGVYRRFNIHINTPYIAYIDDYAHHPEEISSAIQSVRRLYPNRQFIGIFQPHLYTRTRDFAGDFAKVLSTLDEVILLPIYPAREQPIEGVDSHMLLQRIDSPHKAVVEKTDLISYLQTRLRPTTPTVIMTLGAGDIETLVPELTQALQP